MSDKTFVYEKFVEGVGVHVDRLGTSVYVHIQQPPITVWCSRCSRLIEARESKPLVASTAEGRMNLVLFAAEILKAVTAACRHAEAGAMERLAEPPSEQIEKEPGYWPTEFLLAPAIPGDDAPGEWHGKSYWAVETLGNRLFTDYRTPNQRYDWDRIGAWIRHAQQRLAANPGDFGSHRQGETMSDLGRRYSLGERSFELGAEIMNFYWSLP